MIGLREGYAAWRRLGVRRGTRAALAAASVPLRATARRARVRARPPQVTDADVARALGGADPVAALRGPVREALPTVAAWEERLEAERSSILARAAAVAEHRFDLLGSGPATLGPRIDWRTDFKAGRTWPLDHISRIVVSYPDASDIKVPWELSRFQHLPLLAAAHRLTGEERWLDELGAQLEDWIAANPVERGPNWACTMDVAIRAANWVASLALCVEAAAGRPWLRAALRSLLLHARFIRSHLEWGEVRGNHYLSDVVGLLAVAALFSGSAEGRGWIDWAVGELESEMRHQVRADGVDHEMSVPYHRLVCELFVCGAQAAEALAPGRLTDAFAQRLDAMLQVAADLTRPDGLSPQIGDADSGRFLPLGDYGADPRDHEHLFRQAGRRPAPRGHVALRDGGFYVMRRGELWAVVRCGDNGLGGVGGHAHNDQLSFELCFGADALVVDPGAYLYTADPAARNAFRSTAAHATLRIDGEEQNPLDERLFVLEDVARGELVHWDAGVPVFRGRHHGYERLAQPAMHEREVRMAAPARTLLVTDTVRSAGTHELEWTLPLAPCEVQAAGGVAQARFGACRLEVRIEGVELAVEDGWLSPAYGVRVRAPVLRARRRSAAGTDVTRLELRVLPA